MVNRIMSTVLDVMGVAEQQDLKKCSTSLQASTAGCCLAVLVGGLPDTRTSLASTYAVDYRRRRHSFMSCSHLLQRCLLCDVACSKLHHALVLPAVLVQRRLLRNLACAPQPCWRQNCAKLRCATVLSAELVQITRHYAQQTANLEQLAHPALDALMRNCNSTNLERVRKIKTQHQRLQGRLQGLREVMERYMGEELESAQLSLLPLLCPSFLILG
jgi:hypothetical protein